MRKILLGTTAVVGAALLAPGAFAQPAATQVPSGGGAPTAGQAPLVPSGAGTGGVAVQPTPSIAGAGGLTVRLGGYFAFTGALIQDDWDRARSRNTVTGVNNGNARQRSDFRNDMELNVFIDGRASNGMTYGAVFEFQMDNTVTTSGDGTAVSFDEMYGFITMPNLGTIRFGQEDNAASLLQVRAPASAALGGDAEWDEFIVQTGLADSSPYIISGINDGNDATKIIYLSPQFAGFDFGLSYAFNSGEGERTNNDGSTTAAQRDYLGLTNEVAAAVRYRGTFGAIGVQAGFGAMFADSPKLNGNGQALGGTNPRAQSVNAYTVGAQITAYGFGFGGEYTWGQYRGASVGRTAVNAGVDEASHYAIGLTYTMGPVVFGGLFGQGFQGNGVAATGTGAARSFRDLDDRTHTIWGVGMAYNLAPGLVLFALYNNINDENVPTSAPTNARYTGGSGTTLASFNGSNTRTINIGVAGIRLAF
jgi:predicted porin